MPNSGRFIISLDYELMWGVRDHHTKESYGAAVLGARNAIPRMLAMFEKYNVQATWATVGLLFCETKDEMIARSPENLPTYHNPQLSNYEYLNEVGKNENQDPYYFGYSLLKEIQACPGQEIGTHTFSHYYCLEPGQRTEQFSADIKASVSIARDRNIKMRSIVFPRNQYDATYLEVCKQHGITVYRGAERSWIYSPGAADSQHLVRRGARLADAYINISGHHTTAAEPDLTGMQNVPSSRFMRPFSNRLAFGEKARLRRVIQSMRHAAKTQGSFHLWWHPHNFGLNMEQNLTALSCVLEEFRQLRDGYDFQSLSMESAALKKPSYPFDLNEKNV